MTWKKSEKRLADRLKVWRCRQQLAGCPKMVPAQAVAKTKKSRGDGRSLHA